MHRLCPAEHLTKLLLKISTKPIDFPPLIIPCWPPDSLLLWLYKASSHFWFTRDGKSLGESMDKKQSSETTNLELNVFFFFLHLCCSHHVEMSPVQTQYVTGQSLWVRLLPLTIAVCEPALMLWDGNNSGFSDPTCPARESTMMVWKCPVHPSGAKMKSYFKLKGSGENNLFNATEHMHHLGGFLSPSQHKTTCRRM